MQENMNAVLTPHLSICDTPTASKFHNEVGLDSSLHNMHFTSKHTGKSNSLEIIY